MAFSSSQPSRSGLIAAFAAIYIIWGSTYLAIRVAVTTLPPFLMAGTRFLIAGTLLLVFFRLRGAPWPTARQWRINATIGLLLLLGGNGLVVWAEQVIPSGITALLMGMGPLFIVLTEWAWPGGPRPTITTMVALVLGFAGVAWLAAPGETIAQGGLNPAGVTALLFACIFWALGSIYSRHAEHGADTSTASALQMLGASAGLMVVALVHGDFTDFNPSGVSRESVAAFIYLIVAGSFIGFSAFVWLMKNAPPARVATFAYVNPVVAVFLGWLLNDEPVTSRTLTGSAVIVTAVAIITMQKSRPVPSAGKPGKH